MSHPAPQGAKQRVAVGVGNTTVQVGVFIDPLKPIVDKLSVPICGGCFDSRNKDWECLREALPVDLAADTPWYVASVFQESAAALEDWVAAAFPTSPYRVFSNDDFPIRLCVEFPQQVGSDRVAAAVAVNRLRHPVRPAIFVDAGTAITVNAVNAEGDFLGGAILPGTTTSGRALAKETDQLPEIRVTADELPPALGRNTRQSISSGIFWGSVGAVKELIPRIAKDAGFAEPQLFVTGGFGPALSEQLGPQAEYVSHLVLSGIVIASES